MGWRISKKIEAVLRKGRDNKGILPEEAISLLKMPLHSKETYALMETADFLSRSQFREKAENHFHIGVNVEPCPYNCRFCSLTREAGIFKDKIEFHEEVILKWAGEAESQGADALNIMTTGTFSFERFLDIGRLLSGRFSVPLIANTRDIDHRDGERLLEAGYVGAYHALRLGEGIVTPFKQENRIRSIEAMKEVGLQWMNCIEPVGPEHGPEELVDLMFLAREKGATYSGVMRRINFPGSPMTSFGMISELEMARMVAVSRLVMGDVPKAHCTHEPHTASLIAGANLFFPEVGASPRDGKPDTGKGRGRGLAECRKMQLEMGWDPDLPSNCFDKNEGVKREL